MADTIDVIKQNLGKKPTLHTINTQKQHHFATLRLQGTNIKDAAKLAGLHITQAYKIDKRLKEMNLTHPKTRKLASSALTNILKGKAFGDIENIPASVTMSAVKEVYDRVHAKQTIQVSESETRVTVSIDLSQYQDAVERRSPSDVTLDMPVKESCVKMEEDS